jgi:hypothetical protein
MEVTHVRTMTESGLSDTERFCSRIGLDVGVSDRSYTAPWPADAYIDCLMVHGNQFVPQ